MTDFQNVTMSDDDRKMPWEVDPSGLIYRLSDDINPIKRYNVDEISVVRVNDNCHDTGEKFKLAMKICEFLNDNNI